MQYNKTNKGGRIEYNITNKGGYGYRMIHKGGYINVTYVSNY